MYICEKKHNLPFRNVKNIQKSKKNPHPITCTCLMMAHSISSPSLNFFLIPGRTDLYIMGKDDFRMFCSYFKYCLAYNESIIASGSSDSTVRLWSFEGTIYTNFKKTLSQLKPRAHVPEPAKLLGISMSD